MKKILVAVDFSDLATEILDKSIDIAKAFGGEIYILHIAVPGSFFNEQSAHMPLVNNPAKEEIIREENDLKAMSDYVAKHGIKATSAIMNGAVVDKVIAEAEKFNADLIVVGTHNHGFLYKTLIGSVSDGVIRRSPCPVLIIPQTEP
ncbi:MAG: universal stress protein [Salinivirgaceae bacterium]|nr:universal stress protein [Salinivirgaceae bacterium]